MDNHLNSDALLNPLPQHIGIIMDGNGRWAKRQGLSRSAGHRQGAQKFREIANYCMDIGIPYLTVYAFSTENWKRPADEIDTLMDLLRKYLKETQKHQDKNVCLQFLGEIGALPQDIRQMIEQVEQASAGRTGIHVNVAFNYGGRDEIVHAVRNLSGLCARGELLPQDIDEEIMNRAMYTAGQPDVDLVIRPSGEQRTSNFLIWQAAYAELLFMDVLWPDFSTGHLDSAIDEYRRRVRRFGGL